MPRTAHVTPTCCDNCQRYRLVYLKFNFEDIKNGSFKAIKPHWVALGVQGGQAVTVYAVACPSCGNLTPEIQERQHTGRKICVPDKECQNCQTCTKKLPECNCFPPEYAWEPATPKPAMGGRFKQKKE